MVDYVFGHSRQELDRLMFQASILAPVTCRLLRDMALEPGMRVLDLGCGAGDVALLVANVVGAGGSVTGVDRNDAAVALATERAATAGVAQVHFKCCDIDDFRSTQPYDAVIGRYIMVHQPDPTQFLRNAARHLRPGGTLGLHEILIMTPFIEAHPRVELWDQVGSWLLAALRAGAPHCEAAATMISYFADADLPQPGLFCERPVGGGANSLFYRWATEAVQGVLPHLVRLGVASEENVQLATLEQRLRSEAVQKRAQLLGPTQLCAWAQIL